MISAIGRTRAIRGQDVLDREVVEPGRDVAASVGRVGHAIVEVERHPCGRLDAEVGGDPQITSVPQPRRRNCRSSSDLTKALICRLVIRTAAGSVSI